MNEYFDQKDTKPLVNRLYLVTAIVSFMFLTILIRLWYLQIMKGSYFKGLSENNRIRLTKMIAPRGIVFDINGVRVIENRPGFDITVIREDIKDWEELKVALSALVEISPVDMDRQLKKARGNPPYQPIRLKYDVNWKEAAKIETFMYDLPGIALEANPRRFYPHNGAASHLLGYVGEIGKQELSKLSDQNLKPGDIIGKYGIENTWNEYLMGVDGGKQIEVDALGREIRLLRQMPPKPGNNLYLTIDLYTQKLAAKAMEGKSGSVVALNPKNGKLIAMVNSPPFNPNQFVEGMTKEEWNALINSPFHILTNKAIQGQYSPASTLKPITAAALLEEGIITPSTTIYSGAVFKYAGRDYRDWSAKGHGEINVRRAIIESSDTFFYQAGLKLGIDKLSYYAKGFGLGKKTGLRLKGEKPGLVPSKRWKKETHNERWYEGETIISSVGQGYFLATPLQMANAYAAIANGGTLFMPQAVENVRTTDGEIVWSFSPKEIGRLPISGKTLKVIKRALKGVVLDDEGTARWIRINGIDIAGKTGTAQVVKLGKKRKLPKDTPYKFRDHAWFVGYAPADDPEIVVCVLVEHGGFGSVAAAPIARKVIKDYLSRNRKTELIYD